MKKHPKIQSIQQFIEFKKRQLEYSRIPWLREILKTDIEILEHLDGIYTQLDNIHKQEISEKDKKLDQFIDMLVKAQLKNSD